MTEHAANIQIFTYKANFCANFVQIYCNLTPYCIYSLSSTLSVSTQKQQLTSWLLANTTRRGRPGTQKKISAN